MKDKNYDPVDVFIGLQLKQGRKAKHLSLEQVGEHLGIKKNSYFYYENGRTSISMSDLIKLCQYLNIDINKLMNEAVQHVERNK